MSLDCQLGIVAMWGKWEGFVKWLMECCRVEVWEQNRVLAGFGIGGKIGKRSSTKELVTPYKDPERVFRSSRKLSKTRSLDYLNSPEFNLFSDPEV
ncbi:hypothetical protein Tco_0453860 [Tanacetum coccineum]